MVVSVNSPYRCAAKELNFKFLGTNSRKLEQKRNRHKIRCFQIGAHLVRFDNNAHTPKRGRYGFFVWKMKHGVRRQLPTADGIDYLVLINCIWITTASEQYHSLGNGTMDECNASDWFGWKVIEGESFQWHFFVFGFVQEIRD